MYQFLTDFYYFLKVADFADSDNFAVNTLKFEVRGGPIMVENFQKVLDKF